VRELTVGNVVDLELIETFILLEQKGIDACSEALQLDSRIIDMRIKKLELLISHELFLDDKKSLTKAGNLVKLHGVKILQANAVMISKLGEI